MDKMNMPKMPMCETCRWWRAEHHADDERDEDGHCRRRSPVWGGPGDNFQSDPGVWPATYFDDWCGEHAPRAQEQAPDDLAAQTACEPSRAWAAVNRAQEPSP